MIKILVVEDDRAINGLCGVNYLIYKALIKKSKAKYGEQILALSKEILGE